jgi:hypothetical protein
VTVLYAPWLIACSKKGCFLGPEEEDWCGFRVPLTVSTVHVAPNELTRLFHCSQEFSPPSLSYPELEPTPVPKPKSFPVRNPILLPSEQPVNRSQNTEHTIGAWSSSDVNEFFKYPSNVPPVRAWLVALSGCPSPPHVHTLDPLNSAGKRTYSDAELRWMADTIQWCINEYPDISLNNICAVLVRKVKSPSPYVDEPNLLNAGPMKGPHRTTEGYTSRIRRYLHWFAEKSPLLAKRVYDYNDAYVSAPIVLSDTESPPPPTVQTPTQHTRIQHSLGRAPDTEPKSTRFTAADRAAFIRFAGARPSGMEPTGMERSMDVWLRLAEMVCFICVRRCQDI